MADQDALLAQFMDIAHCSEDKAHFYLSSHKWDLEAGLASFMELEEGEAAGASEDLAEEAAESLPAPSNPRASESGSRPAPRSGNVATLRDFADGDHDHDSDDDKDQSFYAGGEKSGIMMKGGPKKPPATDVVQNILEMAAKARPPEGESEDEDEVTVPTKPQAFTGAGYRLGSEDDARSRPSAPGQPSPQPAGSTNPVSEARPVETAVRHLTFWRNGFTVEDGPLLSYDDPQNQDFLQAIKSGRAPTQLLNVAFGQSVEVKVMQKLDEDYKPPPKVLKPFQGAGHKLGGVASDLPASVPGSFPASAANPMFKLEVDNTQPVTTLQIRLADGTRLVAKFNHTHTVGDIRSFIAA
ncbi:hypothetical protein DFJ74DRAFT_309680 [Hyaloraphidium curvatum]|nr:hypothetical protein DFJ74DRAFT_309680 [Hyaloraphidium curvatum]